MCLEHVKYSGATGAQHMILSVNNESRSQNSLEAAYQRLEKYTKECLIVEVMTEVRLGNDNGF